MSRGGGHQASGMSRGSSMSLKSVERFLRELKQEEQQQQQQQGQGLQ
jgi:hypothetical protein